MSELSRNEKSAHVLHKALNLVISRCFAEDDEEIYQNLKHAYTALIFLSCFDGLVVIVVAVVPASGPK